MEPTDLTPPPAPSGDIPEKYIRTFSGDIDIFQKGGTPGLAPLRSQAPLPAERLVAASPIIEESPLVVSMPALEPEVPQASQPAPVSQPAPHVSSPIETYSDDFRNRVKETQASTATVLAAEQDAAPRVKASTETMQPKSRNRWYVLAGVVLVLVGGVVILISYSQYLTSQSPVVVAPSVVTPIFVDSQEQVSGTGSALLQEIQKSAGEPLALNTVRLLSFNSATSTTDIFSALDLSAPGILLRNIDSTGSMAGIVNVISGESPFFILSVGSYSDTFSGMLSWEPTMQSDLAGLFPLYPAPIVATTTATSTSSMKTTAPTSKATATAGFRDESVSNHDVRIYRDALGRSILLYGYWNQTTLVIARDPASFTEILARLGTSHAVQ